MGLGGGAAGAAGASSGGSDGEDRAAVQPAKESKDGTGELPEVARRRQDAMFHRLEEDYSQARSAHRGAGFGYSSGPS
uniref:SMAP domain-containing protein n=1 Tax=Macrostomum lignano TaxID=282301 RepID=A0A1I8G832_9PLAT